MTEKIKEIFCKNRVCQSFLCRSDGEVLFVENLEVSPKVLEKTFRKSRVLIKLICPTCDSLTTVGLKAVQAKVLDNKPASNRKFLIFRSKFL